jgi:tripartite-type tricarboxylate transporter receptor subunit TctC
MTTTGGGNVQQNRSRNRGTSLCTAAALLCATLIAGPSFGQTFPSKPVKFLVGFAAGGPTDLAARFIAEGMGGSLGQPVIVENRAGASGQIAHDALKTSTPDGYTIGLLMTPTLVSILVSGKPISASEVTPIAGLFDSVFIVLANPNAPLMSNVNTLKDLVTVVKANPGKVNYTSAGPGSTGHLFGARLGIAEGLKWEHIGYKGIGPASVDLLAGRVAVAMGNFPNDVELIKQGKLRALSTSGPAQMARYPGTPSLVESGYGNLSLGVWGGVVGPAGIPRGVADRLTNAVQGFFAHKDLVDKMALHFPEPRMLSPEVLQKHVQDDIEAMAKVVKEADIKLD